MADLTFTVALVRPVGQCLIGRYLAGATLTPGVAVYLSGNRVVSPADGSAVATGMCIGVVIANQDGAVSFASGEEVDVLEFGKMAGVASNLAAGTICYVDDDAGIIADAVGTKVCRVGVGVSASVLLVNPCLIVSS